MSTENTPAFKGKVFITGKIVAVTGLHIGGSKAALDIGGIDLSVIKTARGKEPFIPGSSFKGKLRSMLARAEGSRFVKDDGDDIKAIFGYPADDNKDKKGKEFMPTRLIVRDAFLDTEAFKATFDRENLETNFTESKWENTINRLTGTAEHPRQLERVPAEAAFKFELVYDVYADAEENNEELKKRHLDLIIKAMRLLEDDYLGGHGSRGYGKIKFEHVRFEERKVEAYLGKNGKTELDGFEY